MVGTLNGEGMEPPQHTKKTFETALGDLFVYGIPTLNVCRGDTAISTLLGLCYPTDMHQDRHSELWWADTASGDTDRGAATLVDVAPTRRNRNRVGALTDMTAQVWPRNPVTVIAQTDLAATLTVAGQTASDSVTVIDTLGTVTATDIRGYVAAGTATITTYGRIIAYADAADITCGPRSVIVAKTGVVAISGGGVVQLGGDGTATVADDGAVFAGDHCTVIGGAHSYLVTGHAGTATGGDRSTAVASGSGNAAVGTAGVAVTADGVATVGVGGHAITKSGRAVVPLGAFFTLGPDAIATVTDTDGQHTYTEADFSTGVTYYATGEPGFHTFEAVT